MATSCKTQFRPAHFAPAQLPKFETEQRLAYSLRETAQLLNTSYVSVWRLIKRGLLHPSRALRTPKISRVEIERFLRDTAAVK